MFTRSPVMRMLYARGIDLMEEHYRLDTINWDEYFMGLAVLSALRSKDPSTQVGACIVDNDKKIVSVGYNGMPRGVNDDLVPWGHGEGIDSKYLFVCHAEFNAILNNRQGTALKDCTCYVTLFPCNECAKAIVQVGIKEVVYLEDFHNNDVIYQASRKILELAGVKIRQYDGKNIDITVK